MTFIKPLGVFGLFISIAACQGQTTLVVQGIGGKIVSKRPVMAAWTAVA